MRGVSTPNLPTTTKQDVVVGRSVNGDVAVVRITGLVDERFAGFGDLGQAKAVVIDVSGMTRMTSFGVRQWMRGMDAIPKTISDRYLLGCQMFFIDQLNMVLNFGGGAQILTAVAPYTCTSCGTESGETIDLLAERVVIARGAAPERMCRRCGAKLELDESPESYFAFASKYGVTKVRPDVARQLAELGFYTAQSTADKPPKVIKIVQGEVTYFRIIGTIASTFRARPFVVGAEGEIVIDVSEVERFDVTGQHEWRKLVKNMSAQVTAVTLVDLSQSFLAMAPDSFAVASNVHVASLLVPFRCDECGRTAQHSHMLSDQLGNRVCAKCGGAMASELPDKLVASLQRAYTPPPAASAKLIARREDVLSRALTDAKVAQAGAGAHDVPDAILGNYKIVRKLSAGGMAEVFLANQIGIGGFEKPVALKRIQRKFLESRHLAIDMFLNEAKIAGRLTHPNIVQVFDVGEVEGALYLAMEYVRGKDLRDIFKMLTANAEMMPLGIACYIVREVAHALHHAYWSTDMNGNRLSVVHRDVSPHNIILSYEGAVKLLDFGVALSSVTEQDEPMIVGKWQYMSPEHTTKQIDHRSDLFSLGVVFYLLCSGRMPFSGSTPVEIIDNVAAGKFTPLAGVPAPLADLVHAMLAADPNARPQTGQAVATALAEIARTQHMEISQSEVGEFLTKLFVYEVAAAEQTSATEVEAGLVMDITTIKLAIGSSPMQASGTPAAGLPAAQPPMATPRELMRIAPDSVQFTPAKPIAPAPPTTNRRWWIAAIAAAVLIVVVLVLALR